MPHQTLRTGAPNLPLTPGMVLKLEAQDPTTDAEVAGVTSARWSIYGYDESDTPPDPDQPVEWLEIPAYTGGESIPA